MVQHPPVHVEDQRLRAGAVGQLAHVLGEQEVQPAQPVVARYREHAAVRAVDDRGGPGHGPLLGQEVAAVGRNSGVDIGNRGIGGVGIGHWTSSAPAVAAVPGEGDVRDVQREPAVVGQPFGELRHDLGGDLGDRAAAVAHQVDVLVLVHRVVRGAVPEMGVPHQPQPFEQVQAAVHRGDVHRRGLLLHLGADLLGCRMAEGADGIEHELALRRHPQTAFVQRAAQRGDLLAGLLGAVRPRDRHR